MLVIKRLIKRKVMILGLLAMFYTAGAQNKSYITSHKILATVLSQHYGIPASVILSIAAIESSGGAGPAARVLNNHFGMVGKNHIVTNNGKKSRYKQYNTVIESYLDFCRVISRKKFYPSLKDNNDPKAWVKAISRAGYSEEPKQWEEKVFSVLRSNKL